MSQSHSRIDTENGIAFVQQWVNLTMAAIKPFPTQRNRKSTERNEFDMIFGKSRFILLSSNNPNVSIFVYFANFGQSIEYDKHRIKYIWYANKHHISHFYSTFENTAHGFIVCRAGWWRFSFIRCSETVTDFRISERGGFVLVLWIINGEFCVGYLFWNRIS